MKRASAVLGLLCCSIVTTVHAQSRWLPPAVDMGTTLTAANRATALTRLQAIERLVKQVPELSHPDGFEVTSGFSTASRRRGQGNSVHPEYVMEYRLSIKFYYPKRQPLTDPNAYILFVVNGNEGSSDVDAQGRNIILEEARWPRWPFSTITYGASPSGTFHPDEIFQATAWFTAGGELPWRPVSREDYYNWLLFSAEGKNGEKVAEFKKFTEKTPYEHWLEEAPKRKAEREEALKAIQRVNPTEAVKLRKVMEDAEREAGENFKKSESSDREQFKTALKANDDIRAELNRMTPAQRRLPAIIDTDPARREWIATGASMRDTDLESVTVHRILTPNYDFWRARKSPVEVRTIAVNVVATDAPPTLLNVVYQMYKKFDWRGLAAMVDK
jgi:hypothetical protein